MVSFSMNSRMSIGISCKLYNPLCETVLIHKFRCLHFSIFSYDDFEFNGVSFTQQNYRNTISYNYNDHSYRNTVLDL